MHRLTDNDNVDDAPFQIDPLGVQVKQLHRTEPPVDENLFSGTNSETLPSSALDFTDVTLAFEESAFELLDVTLAREDDRPGVHRPDRRREFYFIRLILTKK